MKLDEVLPFDTDALPVDITHPAWVTTISTVISYTLILGLMFALIFVVPFLIFSFL
jgi:hypothetical protein